MWVIEFESVQITLLVSESDAYANFITPYTKR